MSEKIIRSLIVKGNINDIYFLWADFQNFPYFMKNIKSVTKIDSTQSHWIMEGPMGKDLEWDAQITDQIENKRIAWNSISGDIKTSGQVTFNDINKEETEVTVQIQYVPPVGALGKIAAHLFDNPDKRVEEDLQQFKKYAEGRIYSLPK